MVDNREIDEVRIEIRNSPKRITREPLWYLKYFEVPTPRFSLDTGAGDSENTLSLTNYSNPSNSSKYISEVDLDDIVEQLIETEKIILKLLKDEGKNMSEEMRAEHEWDLWVVHNLINEDDTTLSELNSTKAQMIEQGSKPPKVNL